MLPTSCIQTIASHALFWERFSAYACDHYAPNCQRYATRFSDFTLLYTHYDGYAHCYVHTSYFSTSTSLTGLVNKLGECSGLYAW